MVENDHFGVNFLVENRSKSTHIGRKIDFLDFLNTLWHFQPILRKKNFFRFFVNFLEPIYVFFGFFSAKKLQHVAKIRKIRIWALKNSQKIEKKFFFSGLARNAIKYSKSPKNRFSDRYESILSDFSTKKLTPQNGHFRPFLT